MEPNVSHDGNFPSAHDPLLFTPGPLTTSLAVKQAMSYDIGAWDSPVKTVIKEIREGLLKAAEVEVKDWQCVLMQGSGSFSVEAAVTSLTPKGGKIAVVTNGAYGDRMVKIAQMAGIDCLPITFKENEIAKPEVVQEVLEKNQDITTVGIIHCETTTGLLNDIQSIAEVVKKAGKTYIVDAMSSFGGYTINLAYTKHIKSPL